MISSVLILIFIYDEKVPDLQGVQKGLQLAEKMSKAMNKASYDSLSFLSWKYGWLLYFCFSFVIPFWRAFFSNLSNKPIIDFKYDLSKEWLSNIKRESKWFPITIKYENDKHTKM